MSEEQQDIQGPPMICATKVLKSEGVRIGKIVGDITLPRTVKLVTALAAGAGALIGVIIALIFGTSFETYVPAILLGGGIGYLVTTYSPLKGESFGTWLTLQVTATRSNRRIDGKPVTLAVGVANATRLPAGKVTLHRSALKVAPGAVDERGVMRTKQAGRRQA